MDYVNISDAKINFSKYLKQVANGGESIVICNNRKPVAQLVQYNHKKTRRLGLCKGKIFMSEDFDEPCNILG